MDGTRAEWNRYWDSKGGGHAREIDVGREFRSFYWGLLEPGLLARHGTLEGLRTVELGSGSGTISLLLALRGARVTLVDQSAPALDTARALFARHGAHAEFIEADLLAWGGALSAGGFDLSLSLGTGEHFVGEARRAFWEVHRDLLAPGGLAFVSVPNAACPPYRLYAALSQRLGFWEIGVEVPYSRREVRGILDAMGGVRAIRLAGSPFGNDAAGFLAGGAAKFAGALVLPRARRAGWNARVDRVLKRLPRMSGPLDGPWGYSLVALFERGA